MKYRKRPVVVEAVQFTGNNFDEVCEFMKVPLLPPRSFGLDKLVIHTLEGRMEAQPNDYIIKGVKGEFYPCKPDIFEQTYERVDE